MASLKPLLPLVAALFYGASPIDLIPDILPLLGWSDDVTVLLVCVALAIRSAKAIRDRRTVKDTRPQIIMPAQKPR